MPPLQRRGYKAEQEADTQTEPLDEQQQEELIESLKTRNEESNAQVTNILQILTGLLCFMLILFGVIQIQDSFIGTLMALVASGSVGFSFFVLQTTLSLAPDEAASRPLFYGAAAASAFPALAFLLYDPSNMIRFIYLVPFGFFATTTWMAKSMRELAVNIDGLEGLKYKMKGA
ncbi:hypothetical protein BDR26DRAFT_1007837 [Obelidium mucronatum]|nr:hypothetical protein BDR26DRAFT_1007837 [Obelidium mucronatum]